MTVTPRPNYHLDFDGVDDRVTLLAVAKLAGMSYITCGAWVVADWREMVGNNYAIFNKAPSRDYFVAILNTGRIRFEAEYTIGGSGANQSAIIPDIEDVFDGKTWRYITVTYDGADIRYYIDGVFFHSNPRVDTLNVALGVLLIGQNLTAYEWWPGKMGPIHIYDRALLPAEVAYNYKRPNRPRMDGSLLVFNQDKLDGSGVWHDDAEAVPHVDGVIDGPEEVLTNPLMVDVEGYP